MATYMDLLNEMSKKSKDELRNIVDHYAAEALEGLRDVHGFKVDDACTMILLSMLTTISSDGYFNNDEFYVAQPVLNAVIGEGITYDQTLELIKKTRVDSNEMRSAIDKFVDCVDADTKYALFVICGAVCAADKSLNQAELSWLDRLIG